MLPWGLRGSQYNAFNFTTSYSKAPPKCCDLRTKRALCGSCVIISGPGTLRAILEIDLGARCFGIKCVVLPRGRGGINARPCVDLVGHYGGLLFVWRWYIEFSYVMRAPIASRYYMGIRGNQERAHPLPCPPYFQIVEIQENASRAMALFLLFLWIVSVLGCALVFKDLVRSTEWCGPVLLQLQCAFS